MSDTTKLFLPLAHKWLESIPLDDIQERADGGNVNAAYHDSDPQPNSVFVFPTAARLRDYAYQFS